MSDKLVPLTKDELQKMLDNSPFIAFLGLKVTEPDPAKTVVGWNFCGAADEVRGKDTQCTIVVKYGMKRGATCLKVVAFPALSVPVTRIS